VLLTVVTVVVAVAVVMAVDVAVVMAVAVAAVVTVVANVVVTALPAFPALPPPSDRSSASLPVSKIRWIDSWRNSPVIKNS
jgi:hypothetical protein